MSPEQCDPESTIDVRTDVYSFGFILFELVYGSLPYDLSGMSMVEAIHAIRSQPPRTVAKQGHPIPFDVQLILVKALEKSRHDRYSSVEALSEDIGRYLESRPDSGSYCDCGVCHRKIDDRNRWFASAIGLLLLAVTCGTHCQRFCSGGKPLWRSGSAGRPKPMTQKQLDDRFGKVTSPTCMRPLPHFRIKKLLLCAPRLAAAPKQHRNWEWDYLKGMVEIDEQNGASPLGMIFSFAVSPDRIALCDRLKRRSDPYLEPSRRKRLSLFDLFPVRKNLIQKASRKRISNWRFERDRRRSCLVRTMDAFESGYRDSGRLEVELSGHQAPITNIAVRPDGIIASTCTKQRLKFWGWYAFRRGSGEISRRANGVQWGSFCDQGRVMITWDKLGSIWLRDGGTRQIIRALSIWIRFCASERQSRWKLDCAGGRTTGSSYGRRK